MNIAIIIGISKYSKYSGGHEIIAPQKDASRIKRLLEATDKYKAENILYISENTVAATVKNNIRSFLRSYETLRLVRKFYTATSKGLLLMNLVQYQHNAPYLLLKIQELKYSRIIQRQCKP